MALAKAARRPAAPLATPTLVIAANAPDADMLAYTAGPYFALAFRRGITHGWPAMLVLPVLVAGAMVLWDRHARRVRDPHAEPARFRSLLALAALGVATHPLLDWMNSYGMRWEMPFDGTWSYGDALFIIDPWIWMALGGALYLGRSGHGAGWRVLWGGLAALTSVVVLLAPVGDGVRAVWLAGLITIIWAGRTRAGARVEPAPRSPRAARVGSGPHRVRVAIALTGAYVFGALTANRFARDEVRVASHDSGLEVVDVMVQPVPGTPFTGDIEVTTPEGYVPGTYRWLARPRVILNAHRMVPRLSTPADVPPESAEAILARARAHPEVRDYLIWARYPFASVEPADPGWRVRFGDARYDGRRDVGSLGGVEVTVDAGEGVP